MRKWKLVCLRQKCALETSKFGGRCIIRPRRNVLEFLMSLKNANIVFLYTSIGSQMIFFHKLFVLYPILRKIRNSLCLIYHLSLTSWTRNQLNKSKWLLLKSDPYRLPAQMLSICQWKKKVHANCFSQCFKKGKVDKSLCAFILKRKSSY